MPLIFYPDPIFKQQAQPITKFGEETTKLEKLFHEALKIHNALGLGANMLGLLQRVIIVSDGQSEPIFMINPVIESMSKEMEEGAEASLSIPGISCNIKRYSKIKVTYQDSLGVKNFLGAEGLLARVVQHELDYLNGITIFDHLPKAKRMMLLEKYAKIRKNYNSAQGFTLDGAANEV
jgi:peptide deformylase